MQKNNATLLVVKLMNIPSTLIEQLPLTHFQISDQVRLMILRLNFDALRLRSSIHNGGLKNAQPKVLNLVFDEQKGNKINARSITKIADTSVAHIGRGEFSSFEAFSSLIADLGYDDLQVSSDFWLPARSVLTFREIEVLHHVYNGMSSKQIADELNLSARTVELHRQNCSKKIGAITPRALTRLFSSKVLETYMWSMVN
jgi:DNA-binding CsgD family transcriptional regulator